MISPINLSKNDLTSWNRSKRSGPINVRIIFNDPASMIPVSVISIDRRLSVGEGRAEPKGFAPDASTGTRAAQRRELDRKRPEYILSKDTTLLETRSYKRKIRVTSIVA